MPTDSLRKKDTLEGFQLKLDSLKQETSRIGKFTSTLDSLDQKKLSSINKIEQESDSIYQQLAQKEQALVNQIDALENKITAKQDSLQNALKAKLTELRKQPQLKNPVDSQWQKVNKNLPQDKLSDHQDKINDVQNKAGKLDKLTGELNTFKLDPKLAETYTKEIKLLEDLKKEHQNLKGQKTKISSLKGEYGKTLSSLSKHKEKFSVLSSKVEGVQQQLQSVDGLAERSISQLEEVQAFEQQKAGFDPQLSEMEQLKEEDYAKQQLVDHAKKAAVDHFAGQEEKLQEAQKKLKKLKQKMGQINQASGDEKTVKKQNEMKEKSLKERLLIGGNFQIQPGKEIALDISPQLAYRLTKHMNVGFGGTYRTSIDEKEKFLISDKNETFGYRAFLEHDVKKGIFVHGEYERLKNRGVADNENNKKKWHEGALFGIGKHYRIRNRIKGNVMLLYNFTYDVDGPYPRPWNIRFGFEIINKKKEDKEAVEEKGKG